MELSQIVKELEYEMLRQVAKEVAALPEVQQEINEWLGDHVASHFDGGAETKPHNDFGPIVQITAREYIDLAHADAVYWSELVNDLTAYIFDDAPDYIGELIIDRAEARIGHELEDFDVAELLGLFWEEWGYSHYSPEEIYQAARYVLG